MECEVILQVSLGIRSLSGGLGRIHNRRLLQRGKICK